MKSLKDVVDKTKEINRKVEKIKEKTSPGKEADSEAFYLKNMDIVEDTKRILLNARDKITQLVKGQKEVVNTESPGKQEFEKAGRNIREKTEIEENVKKIGRSINQAFETVTPQGFMRYLAKEMLELFKDINEKFKEFEKKTEEFGEKFMKKNVDKKMENIKSFNTEKIKEHGLLALDDKTINDIYEMNKLQETLVKTGIIDKETAQMLENGQFDELGKKVAEKTIPMTGIVGTLIEFNKKTMEIVENVAEYTKNKAQEMGISGSQVVQNQLQDINSEKAAKISGIVLEVAEKVPHPYAQAVAKGAKAIQYGAKGISTIQKQQAEVNKEKKERERGV